MVFRSPNEMHSIISIVVLTAMAHTQIYDGCTEYCNLLRFDPNPQLWRPDCLCDFDFQSTYNRNHKPTNLKQREVALDTSAIYYEPSDEYPYHDISFKDYPFYIANPIPQRHSFNNRENRKIRKIDTIRSDRVELNRPLNVQKPHERMARTIDMKVNDLPLYLDIDIYKTVKNERSNDIKEKEFNNIKLTEDDLMECIDLHILILSRERDKSVATEFIKLWDDPKYEKYKSLSDSDLMIKIKRKCHHPTKIIRESLQEIKKTWPKKSQFIQNTATGKKYNNLQGVTGSTSSIDNFLTEVIPYRQDSTLIDSDVTVNTENSLNIGLRYRTSDINTVTNTYNVVEEVTSKFFLHKIPETTESVSQKTEEKNESLTKYSKKCFAGNSELTKMPDSDIEPKFLQINASTVPDTISAYFTSHRLKNNDSDIKIPRIITQEFNNDSVVSSINGTELLPNNDFTEGLITRRKNLNQLSNSITTVLEKSTSDDWVENTTDISLTIRSNTSFQDRHLKTINRATHYDTVDFSPFITIDTITEMQLTTISDMKTTQILKEEKNPDILKNETYTLSFKKHTELNNSGNESHSTPISKDSEDVKNMEKKINKGPNESTESINNEKNIINNIDSTLQALNSDMTEKKQTIFSTSPATFPFIQTFDIFSNPIKQINNSKTHPDLESVPTDIEPFHYTQDNITVTKAYSTNQDVPSELHKTHILTNDDNGLIANNHSSSKIGMTNSELDDIGITISNLAPWTTEKQGVTLHNFPQISEEVEIKKHLNKNHTSSSASAESTTKSMFLNGYHTSRSEDIENITKVSTNHDVKLLTKTEKPYVNITYNDTQSQDEEFDRSINNTFKNESQINYTNNQNFLILSSINEFSNASEETIEPTHIITGEGISLEDLSYPSIHTTSEEHTTPVSSNVSSDTPILNDDIIASTENIIWIHPKYATTTSESSLELLDMGALDSSIVTKIAEEEVRTPPTQDITGKLFFLFGENQQIPVRFVQNASGQMNLGIDGDTLCDKIIQSGRNSSIIIQLLCNCFTYKNCTDIAS